MKQAININGSEKASTCAITGMRPHKLSFREGDEHHSQLMKNMENAIRAAIERGYITFLSGGAMGRTCGLPERLLI